MPKESFNDTSTAERPAKIGSETLGSAGASPPSAKGTPPGVVKADGTENMRADHKTKQAAPLAPASGAKKHWSAGVTSYEDSEV